MRVLVLGAGFGGLELATCLSEALGDRVRTTLIDKSDSFVFGYSKLDVMFGKQDPHAIHLPYRAIDKPGVEFKQEQILSIDPDRKRVVTDRGTHDADVLVVTLGADLEPASTPGLVEHGYEFYSVPGAKRAAEILPEFGGGAVVVAVTTPHYKCPPAPSETVMMMHDYLLQRGLRDKSSITLVTPFGSPLPVSPEVGATIKGELSKRDIGFIGGAAAAAIEPGRVVLADGSSIPADLVLGVPLHVAPKVVRDSGLTDNGWIAVDKYTLKTKFPDVYAYGDVASVGVPRAGIFAEGQGRVVAEQIIARVRSQSGDARYDGIGICYLEMGGGIVGRVDVNFLGGPSTTAEIHMPSEALRAEKTHFGSSRRKRWFGIDS